MIKVLTAEEISAIQAGRRTRGDYMQVIKGIDFSESAGYEYELEGTPFEGKKLPALVQSFKQNFDKDGRFKVKVWPNEETQTLYFIRLDA